MQLNKLIELTELDGDADVVTPGNAGKGEVLRHVPGEEKAQGDDQLTLRGAQCLLPDLVQLHVLDGRDGEHLGDSRNGWRRTELQRPTSSIRGLEHVQHPSSREHLRTVNALPRCSVGSSSSPGARPTGPPSCG